jgi:hypothetical protein
MTEHKITSKLVSHNLPPLCVGEEGIWTTSTVLAGERLTAPDTSVGFFSLASGNRIGLGLQGRAPWDRRGYGRVIARQAAILAYKGGRR